MKKNKAPSKAEIEAANTGYNSGLQHGYKRGYEDGALYIASVFFAASVIAYAVRLYYLKGDK